MQRDGLDVARLLSARLACGVVRFGRACPRAEHAQRGVRRVVRLDEEGVGSVPRRLARLKRDHCERGVGSVSGEQFPERLADVALVELLAEEVGDEAGYLQTGE